MYCILLVHYLVVSLHSCMLCDYTAFPFRVESDLCLFIDSGWFQFQSVLQLTVMMWASEATCLLMYAPCLVSGPVNLSSIVGRSQVVREAT